MVRTSVEVDTIVKLMTLVRVVLVLKRDFNSKVGKTFTVDIVFLEKKTFVMII